MTEIDRELQAQLVGEVYLPLVAHLTLFALLLALVWSAVPPQVLAWWGGGIVGVSGIRTILWNVARRRNLQPRRAALMARATMLALGLAWGVGAAFLFRYLPVADVALILLGLTGLLAGGLATLVADRWVFPIYAIAMFVPPTVVVGVTGPGLFDEFGVVLMVIYVAFAIRLHLRSYASLRKRVTLEANQRALLQELQASIAEVKVLQGILPICASCKRIRSDDGHWEAVESYVRAHTNAEFTHGLCPDCAAKTWR